MTIKAGSCSNARKGRLIEVLDFLVTSFYSIMVIQAEERLSLLRISHTHYR